MPHLIIEYSGNLTDFDTSGALQALNQAVAASGQVADTLDIKARAVRQDTYFVGEPGEDQTRHGFVHVTLLLLAGRTPQAKQAISQGLMEVLQTLHYPPSLRVQFSVELRDMERETYGKAFRPASA